MDALAVSNWMLTEIEHAGCVYQDDVVGFLLKSKTEDLLRENADGNLVIGTQLLKVFRELTETTVVWVKSDRYWRTRVPEDEPGREARG